MNRTLNIVDAIMGTGKTTAMIRYINESDPDRRYIFCTPLLTEIERLKTLCQDRNFVSPDDSFTSKAENIKTLIRANLNIATTHSLFLRFDDETKELIRDRKYTLIVDETMDVLGEYDIAPADARTLSDKYCAVMDDGQLVWTAPDYMGRFDDYRLDVESGIVYQYSPSFFVKMCQIDSFEVFQEVFLLTYLFAGQPAKVYFDFNGWNYRYWNVKGNHPETYELTTQPVDYEYPDYRSLITIKHTFKGSRLKTDGGAFSLSWYNKHCPDSADFEQLKKHMLTFFRTYGGENAEANMWTTFKRYRKDLSGARYTKGFLYCNARAANDFRHKTSLAYPINRYVNPNVANFITKYGGKINRDNFALSEMIQWVWRSAIRDKKPISIYIPSDRMYRLFTEWLNSIQPDSHNS